MASPYKTVLVIGATSGIGLALAEKLIENESFVVAVGRRQDKLDSFVKKHGSDKASAIQFDITKLSAIPNFVSSYVSALPKIQSQLTRCRVTKEHPNLDSVILNSGIQRGMDFTKPETIKLDVVGEELTTNYLSIVHLTTHFLPFLQSQSEKGTKTSLVYMTSGLALMPILRCPNYCATKAAVHHLVLTLREQLRVATNSKNIKIIEILPPAVQTELHDEKHQPDIKNGGSMGMPLKTFTEDAWQGLISGQEDVSFRVTERPQIKELLANHHV